MKLVKRIAATLLICLTVTVATPTTFMDTMSTVEAHSGRTDRNGGHKDNKNKSGLGSYHYHCGGNPAHLHENGVCPYAGTTNSNSSSTASTSNAETAKASAANTTSTAKASTANTAAKESTADTSKNTEAVSTIIISDTSYDNVAFNASYYANHHSDVYKTCGDDAKALYNHFITSGIKEGRQSSEQFSINVYKNNNQDLADAFGDDLIKYYNHYIESGYKENRVSK